jgi:putative SOS response-associated peptidase YedK
MCGRYASARKRIELLEEFSVQRDRVTEPLAPDYNVAPTKPVYAVLSRAGRRTDGAGDSGGAVGPAGAGDPGKPGKPGAVGSGAADLGAGDLGARDPAAGDLGVARELRVVRWGLVPSWAKDTSIGSRLINARAETLSEKPSFRRAFAKRRCLLPADGYYEWQVLAAPDSPGGTGKKAKQPFFIHRADGGPLAFAGLYELWRDRAVPDGDPDAWLWTATIITTSAPDELGKIHDRMPMVIAPQSWADWLDPANSDVSDVQALLAPAVARGLASYPVSTAVNSVRNNGPDLIEPVPADQVAPLRAARQPTLSLGSSSQAHPAGASRARHGGPAGEDRGGPGPAPL